MAFKKGHEIATADFSLATITTSEGTPRELGLKTGTQITVDTEFEETDDINNIVKGELIAKKRGQKTITGATLTLTDNVFNPELLQILQGGTITYESDGKFKKYSSPAVGDEYTPVPFTLNIYTAQYDTTGLISCYLKYTYYNCTGEPVAYSSEDDTFLAPEYSIKSAPGDGQSHLVIEKTAVDELPVLGNADWATSV